MRERDAEKDRGVLSCLLAAKSNDWYDPSYAWHLFFADYRLDFFSRFLWIWWTGLLAAAKLQWLSMMHLFEMSVSLSLSDLWAEHLFVSALSSNITGIWPHKVDGDVIHLCVSTAWMLCIIPQHMDCKTVGIRRSKMDWKTPLSLTSFFTKKAEEKTASVHHYHSWPPACGRKSCWFF